MSNPWRADSSWKAVDFISDLHLAEELPATFDAWRRYLARTSADAVFILGDLFETWIGDDSVARPFERRCVEVLAEAAARRPVALMHGNRDFLLGEGFAAATGVRLLADPTALAAFGQVALLTHGDALCLADRAYQDFRAQVRSPAWQARFLAQPLEQRAALAARMRAASREHQRAGALGTWADADPALAAEWLRGAGADTLIHGHTHRPATEPFAGAIRHVLSDWDMDAPCGATPAPARAEVLRWSAAGFTRLVPEAAG